MKRAFAALERASLRLTQPRISILKALIADHGPFSVDEIRSIAGSKDLDRVTIYRCLTAFEEIGLVRRCEFGDSTSRYEYSADEHHHHHVICKRCRKVENVEECIPKGLINSVRSMGYVNVSHSLEFFGVCKRCSDA
ncbi:MAG: Fur family transcriptional regulator [Oligoflexia bacterium]